MTMWFDDAEIKSDENSSNETYGYWALCEILRMNVAIIAVSRIWAWLYDFLIQGLQNKIGIAIETSFYKDSNIVCHRAS